MGRAEPSLGRPPPALRRDARAKKARATLNKVIPSLLSAHPRAQRGVDLAELIVDPPPARSFAATAATVHREESAKVNNSGGGQEALQLEPSRGEDGGRESRQRRARRNADGGGRGNGKEIGGPCVDQETSQGGQRRRPRITLRMTDTLAAAHSLLYRSSSSLSPSPSGCYQSPDSDDDLDFDLSNTTSRVGILNMASPLSPGGGFLNGATSQEESLCMRTTLLPSLRDEFYRLPELGAVYTPDVLVFRSSPITTDGHGRQPTSSNSYASIRNESGEDILPKRERWFVSCVTAAMLRLPETEDDGCGRRYASGRDREMAARKMHVAMRVFHAKGCRRVVLGAWGCGAYGNPVGEVARAWRNVLLGGSGAGGDDGGERGSGKVCKRKRREWHNTSMSKKKSAWEIWDGIEEIVFAIKDAGLAAGFAKAFGEENLVIENMDDGDGNYADSAGDQDDDGDAGALGLRELLAKIQELEAQVEKAKSPHLRTGLSTVLAGLRGQLPEERCM